MEIVFDVCKLFAFRLDVEDWGVELGMISRTALREDTPSVGAFLLHEIKERACSAGRAKGIWLNFDETATQKTNSSYQKQNGEMDREYIE